MKEQWLEEFIYRGRPPSGPDAWKPPTWHVQIGIQDDHPFVPQTKVRELSGPMTPEQAAVAGWDLPAVIAEINGQAIARANEMTAKAAELEKNHNLLQVDHRNTTNERDTLKADFATLKERTAAIEAERDGLMVANSILNAEKKAMVREKAALQAELAALNDKNKGASA